MIINDPWARWLAEKRTVRKPNGAAIRTVNVTDKKQINEKVPKTLTPSESITINQAKKKQKQKLIIDQAGIF